jgi:hypothetical protein
MFTVVCLAGADPTECRKARAPAHRHCSASTSSVCATSTRSLIYRRLGPAATAKIHIASPPFRGFAQSGFNEVACRGPRPRSCRAASQKPPDFPRTRFVIQDCRFRGGSLGEGSTFGASATSSGRGSRGCVRGNHLVQSSINKLKHFRRIANRLRENRRELRRHGRHRPLVAMIVNRT